MQQNDLHAEKGTGVFRYRLSSGFLKKHILIRLKISGFSLDFFDDFVEPDKEILLMVPQNNNSTIFLYENNKLIKTQIFDSW
jgi:hypothetical protein